MLRSVSPLRRKWFAILTFALCFVTLPAFGQDVFPDKALEAAVRREVFDKRYNTEPITAEDVKNISQVVGKGKGIKSLEGLQHCKAIMKLDLENNEIVDLTPIKELKLLQSIDLSSNKIESLEPMTQLVNAQYLQLSKNAIADVTALKDMSNLRSLYISENKIKSLEPLAGLKKMWTLNVAGNPVENLAPIAGLKSLDHLNFKGCGLKSVEFTRNLMPQILVLNGNPIEDFGPLVEACEADSKSERRFAQFLRLYLDEDILKNEKHAPALERLRTVHVKINPPNP
jgi:Leucine-rich repeat (LRR) protein